MEGVLVIIRKATIDDLKSIKALADQEKIALGFTFSSVIQEGIEQGYIFVAEYSGEIVGFQQYYHRKRDAVTTLYRKTVAKDWRNKGIGKMLVDEVKEEARHNGKEILRLKCPIDNASNQFHMDYGFELIRVDPGKRRKLNVYEYKIGPK
jgi:ribosomal protein S18 acetylase RimI-like enzyme